MYREQATLKFYQIHVLDCIHKSYTNLISHPSTTQTNVDHSTGRNIHLILILMCYRINCLTKFTSVGSYHHNLGMSVKSQCPSYVTKLILIPLVTLIYCSLSHWLLSLKIIWHCMTQVIDFSFFAHLKTYRPIHSCLSTSPI